MDGLLWVQEMQGRPGSVGCGLQQSRGGSGGRRQAQGLWSKVGALESRARPIVGDQRLLQATDPTWRGSSHSLAEQCHSPGGRGWVDWGRRAAVTIRTRV